MNVVQFLGPGWGEVVEELVRPLGVEPVNPAAANQLSNGLGMPLMFFSGAMLPLDVLPGTLPEIARVAVPFTSLIEAMRGIALYGNPITEYGTELLIGAAWGVAALALATKAYRFDQE